MDLLAMAASIYAGLAKDLLKHLHRSMRKKLEWPEKEKAIDRCLKAGVEELCLGLESFPEAEQERLGTLMEAFFDEEDTVRELSFLLVGKTPNHEELGEIFREAAGEGGTPKGFSFEKALSRFEETFVDAAAGEKELVDSLIFGEARKLTRTQRKLLDETREQTDIQEGMARDVHKLATAGEREEAEARRRYLEALARDYLKLPLSAMSDELPGEEAPTLDQVYIELDTTASLAVDQKGNPVDPDRVKDFKDLKSRPVKALEAAAENHRLVLLGDPGSGKSTFVKKLCALLARGQAPEGFPKELLPAFVQLRDLTGKVAALMLETLSAEKREAALAGTLQQQVAEELIRLEVSEFAEALCRNLRDGHCLLVLDGLDEVPFHQRALIQDTVQAILSKYQPKHLIITCRIRSYEAKNGFPAFRSYTLAPFDPDKIESFVKGWYGAQSGLKLSPKQRDLKIGDLTAAALSGELKEIAANPMLLTTMAVIHQRDVGLPDKRVQLYDLAVDVLVRRWRKHKIGEALTPSEKLDAFLKDDLKLRAALERLAYEAHDRERDPQKAGDLERLRALEILDDPDYLGSMGLAEEFLDYIDQKSGLLTGRGGALDKPVSYGFPHRTFQEYLAGSYLVGLRDMEQQVFEKAREGDYWSVGLQLGFEELLYNRRGKNPLLSLAYHLCEREKAEDEAEERCHLWSAIISVLLGAEVVAADTHLKKGGKAYLQRLRRSLVNCLRGELGFEERAEAGRHLSRLGELESLGINPLYQLENTGRELSGNEFTAIFKKHGFFDSRNNKAGNGCLHIYEPLQLKGKNLIFDHATGLMWQQSGSEEYGGYEKARAYINQLNQETFAGFSDWRLPTLEEGMSLMERERKNGNLYIDPVFDSKQRWIWSADRYSASLAWYVNFSSGHCFHLHVLDFYYVRAVRSGQSSR